MSHEDGGSYILDRQGMFHFVKGHTALPVGTEIVVEVQAPKSRLPRVLPLVACFLVFMLVGGMMYGQLSGAYAVYVDINPSIQIHVNHFSRVKDVTALNAQGETLIAAHSFRGMHPEEAVLLLVMEAKAQGYTQADGAMQVLVSVAYNGRGNTEGLASALEQQLLAHGVALSAPVVCYEKNDCARAEALGISPGKLKLAQALHGLDPATALETLATLPVQVLAKSIHAIEKEAKEAEKAVREAAKEADAAAKDAERAAKAAEKAAEVAAKDAEKAAKDAEKAAKEAAKEADEAVKAAEKAAKDAEREAEKAAKDAEKAAKNAEQAAKDAAKAAEKAVKEVEKSAAKQNAEAAKAAEQAAKDSAKEAEAAEKAAEKAAKEAEKAAEKAQKEAEKAEAGPT